MTPHEIVRILQERFGGKITLALPDDRHPRVHVDAGDWRNIAEFVFREPALQLDWLQCLSGVDYVADNKMACVYDLWSFENRHALAIKVLVGMQPVLTQVPPTNLRSMMAVFRPVPASRTASAGPD